LIDIVVNDGVKSAYDDSKWDDTILSSENGDNWYYFEDARSDDDDDDLQGCLRTKDDAPPLTISSRSADGTTLIHFKYDDPPPHEVLHAGKCRFTGLVNVGDDDDDSYRSQKLHRNMEF
jgi:hypothetical protein